MLEHIDAGHRPAFDETTFTDVLRRSADALRDADVDFLVMGGIASTVHGRDRWTHDIDFFVRKEDAGRALEVLAGAGFDTEETFWDWLYKAWKDDVMVDLIFRSSGGITLDDAMLERATDCEFRGIPLRAAPAEDLVVMKVVAHDEHMPRHWHDALSMVACSDLDWDYLLQRARRYGARRVLALLVYAQSNDLIVPNRVIEELFDAIYRS